MGSLVAELAEKLSSATNNLDFDEQTLYLNTSADTVGIGTNSPDGKLDVRQSGTDDILNLYDGASNILTVQDGGALTHKGTLTVGVDDTGHDVKFFGDTASKYWLWDTSADGTVLVGSSTQTGNAQLTGTLTVGVNDTGHDVKFFGATSGNYMLWDQSADDLILTNGSNLIVGHTSTITAGAGGGSPALQVLGSASGDESSILIGNFQAGTSGSTLYFYKSRNTTIGSNTIITSGDMIGAIWACGDDGVDDDTLSSSIEFDTEGTVGANRIPGLIRFSTATDANPGVVTERMRINSSGNVGIGTTAPGGKLHLGDDTGTDLLIQTSNNTDTNSPRIFFRKSGGTMASPTIVADDELIGSINGYAYDGNSWGSMASIIFDTVSYTHLTLPTICSV